mmetsp:Transcript_14704/g.25028  ORF Transcript_14704/g.25028 Transcript_14704/m.25028 type:complete len:90 (+) Transcript_14704:242-511(+)
MPEGSVQKYLTRKELQVQTPRVSDSETDYKNTQILNTSMGIVNSCYWQGYNPLFWDNDAGSFFSDCMTMWTMYVFFYQDQKLIDYSQFA